MKTKYVVGFLFNKQMDYVLLIRKQKPKFQAGLLNGVGGKVEEFDASPLAAMHREFSEETTGGAQDWKNFCSMAGNNNDGGEFEIEFFFAIQESDHQILGIKSKEAEQLEVHSSNRICAHIEETLGNVPWLVALALDFGQGVHPPKKVTVNY